MLLPPIPTVSFSWTPTAFALTYTFNGNNYPYDHQADGVGRTSDSRYAAYATPINTLITFTADISLVSPVFITEYRWDFGDGGTGYGPTIGHTFKAANPATQVSLIAKDNYGRTAVGSAMINPRVANVVEVSQGIIV